MPYKRKLVVANWKMNGLDEERREVITQIAIKKANLNNIVICPPFTALHQVGLALQDTRMHLGAQDCHFKECGPYTGEVSAKMLKINHCDYVIVGHSERRRDHHETDILVQKKADAVRKEGMIPIICIGETQKQRDEGKTLAVIEGQLMHCIPEVATSKNTVIAYEPVWAIGTGKTPTMDEIKEVHDFINNTIAKKLPDFTGTPNAIYGGSVCPDNAKDILDIDSVGGVLVGGASLHLEEFRTIVEATFLPEELEANA